MELRILGPLEAVAEGRVVEVRGQKQRELLAILAVHANEVISADRLIDELWGESPPASAVKTLQAYVSRLRKTLGSGSLTTHGHGYSLALVPGELDAERFAMLLEEGRRTLAAGKPDRAAETLDAALALWRGPALADFTYASFAQSEIARLQELRLAAREERVEADLARGRHAEVIGELEQLVAQNPLRERPRAQLMLALHRSGRQAEALQVYQEGRRTLAEELGLEPSQALQRLERQILEHDPALVPTAPDPRPAARTRSRRRLWAIAAAAVLLVAVGAGAAIARATQNDADADAGSAGAAVLDPDTGEILGTVDLGTSPSSIAIGEGSIWVIDADDRTISQIDSETREVVRTFSTPFTPTDIAVGAGAVWVGNAEGESPLPVSVSRIDPTSGVVTKTIPLAPAPPGGAIGLFGGPSAQHIVASPDSVWVIAANESVYRVDPRTNRVAARIDGLKARNLAMGEGDVWASSESGLVEIDRVRNAVARRVPLEDGLFGSIAIGGGAVWAADPLNGQLLRVSTDTLEQETIELADWVAGATFGEGAVWATSEVEDAVFRVDPRSGEPTRIEASAPQAIAAGDGVVWATTAAPPSRDAALPSSVCSDVYFKKDGEPDVLLVSDLTLKGASRMRAQPMVDAMRSVLEEREFEAGPVTVGYQSCENSTAQAGGLDFFRCASNAKAYTRNLRVVAVFGSFASPCSYAQIPITNEADGGPLAMLSPSNTYHGLTTDDDLYPTGTRSFFRIAAMENLEGSAQVQLANELGHDRIYLLTSEWAEYNRFVDGARETAKRLDADIVGQAVFDHEAESYSDLVREIAKKRPEAIALGAYLTPGSGALVRELHAALDPDVPIVAPDTYLQIGPFVTLIGPAVKRIYASEYGIANDKLPPRGRLFLDAFAATRGGDSGPDLGASYGAQGAELLLDAIARSDGTRASVLDEIRRTRVENGILGDIRFNAIGDLVDGPITFYRLQGERFVPDRVIVVRAPRPASP